MTAQHICSMAVVGMKALVPISRIHLLLQPAQQSRNRAWMLHRDRTDSMAATARSRVTYVTIGRHRLLRWRRRRLLRWRRRRLLRWWQRPRRCKGRIHIGIHLRRRRLLRWRRHRVKEDVTVQLAAKHQRDTMSLLSRVACEPAATLLNRRGSALALTGSNSLRRAPLPTFISTHLLRGTRLTEALKQQQSGGGD